MFLSAKTTQHNMFQQQLKSHPTNTVRLHKFINCGYNFSLADTEGESVPGFEGCNAEGSLAELKSQSQQKIDPGLMPI